MNSSSSQQRLTVKQADARDRRQRMTQRRQEWSSRIRKQKKLEYLSKKRSWVGTPTTSSTTTSSAPTPLFATATTGTATLPSSIDSIHRLVKNFCSIPTVDQLQALHAALQTADLRATEENWLVILDAKDQMTCASLLGHLRGLACSPDTLPTVLDILVKLTAISYVPPGAEPLNYYGNPPLSWAASISYNGAWLTHLVQLAPQNESACVILGNLVGEANTQSFVNLRKAGMIPALLSAVHRPAAAWALTNAIRHDTAEWAQTYCNDNTLSASLLEKLLREPAVSTQAAWMVASLTSREDAVVQYLMKHPSFLQTLAGCLKTPAGDGQIIPLLQSLGNIASANTDLQYPFVGALLSQLPMLPSLIAQLLQMGSQTREVVQQAAWLTGILLHDAGVPDHPSTLVAAPVLVPVLFHELKAGTFHSVDNQRELTQALWNALMKPLQDAGTHNLRDVPLPSWETVRSSLTTLVKLIGSLDSDAVLASVSVVELLVQLNDGNELFLEALHEEDITSTLDKVCDSPFEEAAEIAASLLDDYFYNDDNDIGGEDDTLKINFAFGDAAPMTEMRPGMGRGRAATIPAWMAGN